MLKRLKHWKTLTLGVLAITPVALVAAPAHASGPAPWTSQQWDFVRVDWNIPAFDELISRQPAWGFYNQGLCIDDRDRQTKDGSQVWTWQCGGGSAYALSNQTWDVRNNIDGTVSFISALDDTKCLDVKDWSTSNGAQMQLYTCAWTTDENGNHGNHLNQEFWTGQNPFNDGTWDGSVRSAMDPNKCLTADNDAGQNSNGD